MIIDVTNLSRFTEFGMAIGFIEGLLLATTDNHNALTYTHTLQITTASTKPSVP